MSDFLINLKESLIDIKDFLVDCWGRILIIILGLYVLMIGVVKCGDSIEKSNAENFKKEQQAIIEIMEDAGLAMETKKALVDHILVRKQTDSDRRNANAVTGAIITHSVINSGRHK